MPELLKQIAGRNETRCAARLEAEIIPVAVFPAHSAVTGCVGNGGATTDRGGGSGAMEK